MTSSHKQFIDLIDQIYATVDAPAYWPEVVEEIARQTGNPRSLLFTPHHNIEDGGLWFGHNFAPGELESYIQYYHQTDLWTQRAFERGIPTSHPVDCDTLVAPRELDRSEFYNDYLRHVEIRGAYSVMFGGERDSFPRVHLSVYRPVGSKSFDADTTQVMNTLTPHLHRALELGFRFAALNSRAHDALEALNHLDCAVAALGQDGSIGFMNRRAEQILTSNDGLAIRHQCIIAASHHDNEALWKLLRNTIGALSKGKRSPGGSVAVSRPSGRRSYAVTVAPGAGLPGIAGVPAAWALVFIADPALHPELPAERIAGLYGMTAAEAQLSGGLAAGQTLSEYAEASGLSMHTVRSTLKQVFAKTGTHRQAELVGLLLRIAAADPEPFDRESPD